MEVRTMSPAKLHTRRWYPQNVDGTWMTPLWMSVAFVLVVLVIIGLYFAAMP
jgi:hypothetical protein